MSIASNTHVEPTIYFFSCESCTSHKQLGILTKGCKVHAISNDNGLFQNYILRIGNVFHSIPKGHFGFSKEKSVFDLSVQEAEESFGHHVCNHMLSYRPHLDPNLVLRRQNLAVHRLRELSTETKTSIDHEMKTLIKSVKRVSVRGSKRPIESTQSLVESIGETAYRAFGASPARLRMGSNPCKLFKEISLLDYHKEINRCTERKSNVEQTIIHTLSTNLDLLNLGHLKITNPQLLERLPKQFPEEQETILKFLLTKV